MAREIWFNNYVEIKCVDEATGQNKVKVRIPYAKIDFDPTIENGPYYFRGTYESSIFAMYDGNRNPIPGGTPRGQHFADGLVFENDNLLKFSSTTQPVTAAVYFCPTATNSVSFLTNPDWCQLALPYLVEYESEGETYRTIGSALLTLMQFDDAGWRADRDVFLANSSVIRPDYDSTGNPGYVVIEDTYWEYREGDTIQNRWMSTQLTPDRYRDVTNYQESLFGMSIAPTDPYAEGGTSGPGGGDGTFDWESDSVPFAPLPLIGAMNSGFINLYMPTLAELQNLARYMWAGAFDIDSLKKIVADPMDIILGLSILPVTQAEAEATDGSILIGNLDSQISCKVAQKQFITVDCGTIQILAKWGAYLDFSPHSKLQLYLPYIGFVSISPDDCMNGTIHVAYNIDILSGACLAQVHCTSPGKNADEIYDHVLYEFTGNCATECPVTSGQYKNILSSLFNVASGAAAAGASGNLEPLIESSVEAVKDTFKPQVYRSGGPGKNTGMLGHQAPYLVLTCPRMIIPGDQNKMIGYPSYVTLNLGTLTGYTQVDTIHLSGVPASDNEQNEIIQLLHEGVYL